MMREVEEEEGFYEEEEEVEDELKETMHNTYKHCHIPSIQSVHRYYK